jgi:hypothetical protein
VLKTTDGQVGLLKVDVSTRFVLDGHLGLLREPIPPTIVDLIEAR